MSDVNLNPTLKNKTTDPNHALLELDTPLIQNLKNNVEELLNQLDLGFQTTMKNQETEFQQAFKNQMCVVQTILDELRSKVNKIISREEQNNRLRKLNTERNFFRIHALFLSDKNQKIELKLRTSELKIKSLESECTHLAKKFIFEKDKNELMIKDIDANGRQREAGSMGRQSLRMKVDNDLIKAKKKCQFLTNASKKNGVSVLNEDVLENKERVELSKSPHNFKISTKENIRRNISLNKNKIGIEKHNILHNFMMHENLPVSILKEVEKFPRANNKQDIIIKSTSDLGKVAKVEQISKRNTEFCTIQSEFNKTSHQRLKSRKTMF